MLDNNNSDEEILDLEEYTDEQAATNFTGVNIEDVTAMIAQAQAEKADKEPATPELPTVTVTETKTEDAFSWSAQIDPTYLKDEKPATKETEMIVSVQDQDVAVTKHDQAVYLKATLHGQPVELDVQLEMGLKCTCRSLSVYEGDLVYDALNVLLSRFPDINAALWDGYVQQFRVAMQLVAINGVARDHLEFKHTSHTDRKADAVTLLDKSEEFIYNLPGPAYALYIRALNVFAHKIKRLQDAAFNRDFWKPDGIA